MDQLQQRIEDAMWAGDEATLNQIARCRCCCEEHTFESCEARLWFGCRGQNTSPVAEREAWLRHYQRFHGMTEDQFYGTVFS